MDTTETTGRALKRRGILAAAGAVVSGIAAKGAATPTLAADVVLGADNVFTTGQTSVRLNLASGTGTAPAGVRYLSR